MIQNYDLFPNESPSILRLRMREVELSMASGVLKGQAHATAYEMLQRLKFELLNRPSGSLLDLAAKLRTLAPQSGIALDHNASESAEVSTGCFAPDLGTDEILTVMRKITLADSALSDAQELMQSIRSLVTTDPQSSTRILVERLRNLMTPPVEVSQD